MKKFYKVSLITAGILAAVGLVLCIFCGLIGGYRWKQRVTSEAVASYMAGLSNRLGFQVSFGEGDGIYIGALDKNFTGAAGELMTNAESSTEKETLYEIPVSEVKELNAKLGAGKLQMEGIKAQEMTLKAGAGQLELADLTIEDFQLKVGAGQAVCENVTSQNAVMDIAMGECQYSGKIVKDLSVDCGQGNVEIAVDGAEADHNYDLDCGMGNVTITFQ